MTIRKKIIPFQKFFTESGKIVRIFIVYVIFVTIIEFVRFPVIPADRI